MYRADLKGADLTDANLKGVDLTDAVLDSVNFEGADLTGIIGLTLEQLSKVNTLYEAKLDSTLLLTIQDTLSHLLENPKDPRAREPRSYLQNEKILDE